MPRPRKQQISLDATPYYHCTSRCVRRAFLCGLDALTGNDYEHRRQWVEDRIVFLGEVFCIDICAYAVMSNHHHLVLHINAAEAHTLSDLEVAKRWHTLYKGTPLTQAFVKGGPLDDAQRQAVKEKLDQWRLELASISRFMWALNEPIARRANAEDHCTGRFWESRFKSQALLDEKALAACMAYVDLNPVRAKMATTPESSEHTSIKRRIEALKVAHTHHPIRIHIQKLSRLQSKTHARCQSSRIEKKTGLRELRSHFPLTPHPAINPTFLEPRERLDSSEIQKNQIFHAKNKR
ncbi:transposase [Teredinibacter purpureus]|uniref:transposase n=1 Tax=Teredinibacter purpureus TaxID=2731756 RepID=UPI000AE60337